MELSHSELQKWHYTEVRNNPAYAAQGLLEVRIEEVMIDMPLIQEVVSTPIYKDSAWSTRQWEIINQLRGEIVHIHKDLHELQAKRKKIDYY